ncbi:MAG TPA: CoA-transferase, partial [Myxococcaceae bacterium]|nr:CoA-transferase [Myxococcaceae bacterium]
MDRVTATPESKAMPLGRAVRAFVRAGMHLNFASTPGRSNASVRELARAFVGTSPEFDLSATGFHSLLHLLGLLELGRRYIACFFGDNCPVPKPNPLYTRLRERGAQLEFWSVGSYVASLRAGALGLPYGLVTSLSGSDLGRELAEAGRYRELPDPEGGGTPLGLVTPMRPDVTFLHALAGDAQGRVLCSAPFSE